MDYKVEINTSNNIEVNIDQNQRTNFNVNVQEVEVVQRVQDILNVDSSNLSNTTNNYIMVYDASTNGYKFISPSQLLGYSDGDGDETDIDYGTY